MFERYPDAMSVTDIQKALGIGRTKAYELINSGQIKSIKIGRVIRIPKSFFLDYIHRMSYNGNELDECRYFEGGKDESNG